MTCKYNKTRLAPTPSGFLHLGNVLSFCIAASLARRCSARILLRIDDLDQTRVNSRYLQDIFDTLNFLEIPWDEGPRNVKEFTERYSQVHRMGLYSQALDRLAETSVVFACTCSRKELLNTGSCLCRGKGISLNAENVSWRMATKNLHELTVRNCDGSKIQGLLPAEMQDFVVRKKDGSPAYQLTSIVDDLFYGVDLIVRGKDLWPSTLAQQALAAALGKKEFNNIAFFHHTLLLAPSGLKMSKSAGATSVKYLRESGKSKEEIFGIIAGMHGNNKNAGNWQQLAQLLLRE
ncbi:MAG TPA: glutamate--tRNA ligase family protein [Mucilaginibacter sp.]|jgi:glutamyl-tRNA synthetase|nr:glutamate--tRNA ligase family protein [Mucilaginibacter sp.]